MWNLYLYLSKRKEEVNNSYLYFNNLEIISLNNMKIKIIIIILISIFTIISGFHWQMGRSEIDEILITYIYPIILGIFSIIIFLFIKPKLYFLTPLILVTLRQVVMCIVYSFQTDGFVILLQGMTPYFLIGMTIGFIIISYGILFIFIMINYLIKKLNLKKQNIASRN